MKRADETSINKMISIKFLFQMYIRIIPFVVFYSFWSRYNAYVHFTKI